MDKRAGVIMALFGISLSLFSERVPYVGRMKRFILFARRFLAVASILLGIAIFLDL